MEPEIVNKKPNREKVRMNPRKFEMKIL